MSITSRVLDWWYALSGKFPATIEMGSQGKTVEMWQTVIGVDPPDGAFGPVTDHMTKEWQSAHGIDPDGVVGPLTWTTAMKGIGNASTPRTSGPPPGTKPLAQRIANQPAITAFAIETLKGPTPMGGTVQQNINGVSVLARIEPHTWTHRNGKLVTNLNPPIRGVTLYEVVDSSQIGFDTGTYTLSQHGADGPDFDDDGTFFREAQMVVDQIHQPGVNEFDYGSTDGATNRLGGNMSSGCGYEAPFRKPKKDHSGKMKL